MTTRTWWQRPQLRTDEDEAKERKVTWLELFYDLVFVVVIAELAHSLAGHISPSGVVGFVLLFIPVWWVWIGGTYYNERFATDDLSNRVFTFLQILPVAALAVFAHDGLGETSTGFALSYAAARILLIILWLRGGWHARIFRPVSNRYAIGFSISALLFVISVFVPPPARFVLWGIGLIIDIVTPITTLNIQAKLPRLSTSRLPERFGLFVIIVLGESIVGVVQGVAAQPNLTVALSITAALGMALAFGMWWVYFDFIARRVYKPNVWWALTWGYLHLPLVMSFAAAGAGVLNVVSSESETIPDSVRWLIASAVGVALITMSLIETTLRREKDEPTHRLISPLLKLAAGVLALAIGLWSGLGPIGLLIMLLVLVVIQMAYGAYVWFTQPLPEAEPPSMNFDST
jgi:low temperature requirement protein LtrA